MWPIATEWSVSQSVCLSVGLSVALQKQLTSIEMLFGVWTRTGRGKHVLDGVQIPPCKWAILREKGWPRPIVNYRDTVL